ncbi:MAG: hypothetical protein GF365_00960 [Candidatus Buchananbacteria bacterium]|nr:hypothetical protein [Candidatus Buchananbacteria bacterium]
MKKDKISKKEINKIYKKINIDKKNKGYSSYEEIGSFLDEKKDIWVVADSTTAFNNFNQD